MLNITEIVNNKINSMLESNEIKEKIEKTVENNILSIIGDSVSDYNIRRIIGDKIKKDVSAEVEQISFKGYTARVIENLKNTVESCANEAMTEKIIAQFKETFMPLSDSAISVRKLFDKYIEVRKDYYDPSDNYYESQYGFAYIKNSDYSSGGNWLDMWFSVNEDYESDNNTFRVTFYKTGECEYKITSIYDENLIQKDLTKKIKIGYLDPFERYLMNAYYNETPIIIESNDIKNYEDLIYCSEP